MERENAMLRKANDSLQGTVNQQVKKIKTLKHSSIEKHDEQDITEQITNELLQKISEYENIIEELRTENDQLNGKLS